MSPLKPALPAAVAAALLLLLSACAQEDPGASAPGVSSSQTAGEDLSGADVSKADVETARAAAGELGGALFAALSEALTQSGPEGAITVCNEAAPEIAAGLAETRAMEIGRTALKVRNRANAPDPWERAVLEAFQTRHDAGEPFAAMETADVIVEDGVKTFRWMKAIPMGAPCAACHGEAIAPSTLAAVAALYPEDEAVGFKPGALRGAFTVQKTLDH